MFYKGCKSFISIFKNFCSDTQLQPLVLFTVKTVIDIEHVYFSVNKYTTCTWIDDQYWWSILVSEYLFYPST